MSIFEDTGFDLLPKIPVPGNPPVTIQPIEQLSIAPPAISPKAEAITDPTPPPNDSVGFGWFLFGLFVLGSIGATIYMAKKDSTKKSTEN